jgi:hypothetical protein
MIQYHTIQGDIIWRSQYGEDSSHSQSTAAMLTTPHRPLLQFRCHADGHYISLRPQSTMTDDGVPIIAYVTHPHARYKCWRHQSIPWLRSLLNKTSGHGARYHYTQYQQTGLDFLRTSLVRWWNVHLLTVIGFVYDNNYRQISAVLGH